MPQIEQLEIRNYKVLAHVRLEKIGPFSVLVGPNACGKSTLLDVFGFLADCLETNVRVALQRRGGLREVRSRERTGPIVIELKYRQNPNEPLLTYHLEIDENEEGQPVVLKENLKGGRQRGQRGAPYYFLRFERGEGEALDGDAVRLQRAPILQAVESPDILAIKGLGQLANYPHIARFRRFMEGWFLSYFVANRARESTTAGYAEHLSREGENLALVIQYLQEKHGPVLGKIVERLARCVPGLEGLQIEQTVDGRVVLQVKDTPFARPFTARYVSDGTMKMLAYLVLLNDPAPPPLMCIEEPENNLHPRLLAPLAEEFRAHAHQTQIFISSHSPYFVDALQLTELWWMERGPDGYARIGRVADRAVVEALVREQLTLGSLWFEGHLGGGNP